MPLSAQILHEKDGGGSLELKVTSWRRLPGTRQGIPTVLHRLLRNSWQPSKAALTWSFRAASAGWWGYLASHLVLPHTKETTSARHPPPSFKMEEPGGAPGLHRPFFYCYHTSVQHNFFYVTFPRAEVVAFKKQILAHKPYVEINLSVFKVSQDSSTVFFNNTYYNSTFLSNCIQLDQTESQLGIHTLTFWQKKKKSSSHDRHNDLGSRNLPSQCVSRIFLLKGPLIIFFQLNLPLLLLPVSLLLGRWPQMLAFL